MNTIQPSIIKILPFILMPLLFGCKHDHADGHSHETEDHHAHDHGEETEHHEEGEIHMTKTQVETMNIKLGSFSDIKINDFVKTTGTLGLPPNAYSGVSAKAAGFIKGTNKYVEGNYIKAGVVMAYVENPDFIQQQKEYLEVQAELTYLNQELERQQTLLDANAGITKNVQQLQSQVNMKTATVKGLAKQMAYLGIAVEDITPDHIVDRIAIISPMAGYITSINMHNGMYVTPEMELMEIVNENHLHLELDVFEKDIANVKEHQKISYTVPALGSTVYEGEVHIIGKEFNRDNKTVRVHGHLEEKRPQFIKDLFIEAKIWMNDQTVQALPEKAVIKDGTNAYIFVTPPPTEEGEYHFEKLRVILGTSDNGFVAIKMIDDIPEGMSIVTDGAYYVFAQSIVGELEHSH
ncbi:MAG: efflux RND transporter periplasmic adaptor subunit [Bacteroidetes bacterium]|nr:efflux RND transporter periplasmic adaptor subunit [Bacteroidota bacterium]